jgi:hypothetical protein
MWKYNIFFFKNQVSIRAYSFQPLPVLRLPACLTVCKPVGREREMRTKQVYSPFLLSKIPSKARDLGEREIGIEVRLFFFNKKYYN